MKEAINVIRKIAAITDKAVLFHSATGKDSIALLHLMHPYFKEILCVYMYAVKDLEHVNKYIGWAQRRYLNVRFIQIPHMAVYTETRLGFLGRKQNPNQKLYSLSDLTDIVRVRYNIEWAFFGFKMSDSFKRRLMLRNYTPDKGEYDLQAINYKSKKAYPLSVYKNGDVLRYIEDNGLIRPEKYGLSGQSSGCDPTNVDYLLWLEKNSPRDLQKVYGELPLAERLMFNYKQKDNGKDKAECDKRGDALTVEPQPLQPEEAQRQAGGRTA